MLAQVYAASLTGIEASLVKVEVDVLSRGLPGFSMVGLLETAVKEARDRVGSAIRNAGFAIPNRKTVVNLSPADLKKSGSHYDLAIGRAARSIRRLQTGQLLEIPVRRRALAHWQGGPCFRGPDNGARG